MHKTRVITAVIALPLLALWIWFSNEYFLALVIGAASVIGLYELYSAVGVLSKRPIAILGIASGVVIPFSFIFSQSVNMCLIYLYITSLFFFMLYSHKFIKITDIAIVVIGSIYIPYFLSHIVLLRLIPHGNIYIWLVFICAFSTDTFAYMFGKMFGKKKLCPEISPQKTVAGAIGGILGCGVSFAAFGVVVNKFFLVDSAIPEINIWLLIVMGVISSLIAQIGDISASIIKRQYNIKDYGNILPGHGGMLDRCDSILFAAPAIYIILTLWGR